MKKVTWKRVKNSRLMNHTSLQGLVTVNPQKLVNFFGLPIPSLPDTHGEMVFISSDKKVAIAFYDYDKSKNPWLNKTKATLNIGSKNTAQSQKYLAALLDYLDNLKILVK